MPFSIVETTQTVCVLFRTTHTDLQLYIVIANVYQENNRKSPCTVQGYQTIKYFGLRMPGRSKTDACEEDIKPALRVPKSPVDGWTGSDRITWCQPIIPRHLALLVSCLSWSPSFCTVSRCKRRQYSFMFQIPVKQAEQFQSNSSHVFYRQKECITTYNNYINLFLYLCSCHQLSF